KTVVFAHHKEVIGQMRDIIEAKMPGSTVLYDGSVANKKRQENIDIFQENPDARVFIMSLAGATGITLTAAHRMRVVEPDWSPSNMSQIEDRIWRIGQEHNCDIGYLFVDNSLDVIVGNALINKMEIDEKAVNTISFADIAKKKEAMRAAQGDEDRTFLDVPDNKGKNKARKKAVDENQMDMGF
ncbi:MAG: C-terminal helicase domain-containing protein, partial [Parasphingorhabdus sp.]